MTELKSHENNIAKFDLVVAAEDFEKAVNNVYKKNKSRYRVDGFRKGKVPKRIIEKMYGVEVFYDEAIQEVFPEPYNKAIDELNLEVIDQPSVDFDDIEKGKDVVFKVEVETKPHPTLGDYSELEVTEIPTEVTDEDVEHELKHQQEENARIIPIEDGEAQDGDTVNIDFDGFLDGERFEGGKAEDFVLAMGQGRMIPGFEEGLIGHKAGEEFTIDVTFPEDYHAENLKGKKAQFAINLKKVEERELPELTEEFIKRFGIADGSVDGLRAEVRKNMERELKNAIRTRVKSQVIDGLVKANEVDVPAAAVDSEIEVLQRQAAQRFGGDEKQALQLPRELFEEQAKRRVIVGLLLGEVINSNELKAEDERVKALIDEMASAYEDPSEVVEFYNKNEQLMNNIRNLALEEQAVEKILATAKVTEKETNFTELMNEVQMG